MITFLGSASAAGGELELHYYRADWCAPCRRVEPMVYRWVAEHPDIKLVKLDYDTHKEDRLRFGLAGVPMLVLLNDDKVVGKYGTGGRRLRPPVAGAVVRFCKRQDRHRTTMRFAPGLAGLPRRLEAQVTRSRAHVIEPEGGGVQAGDDRPGAQSRSPLCLFRFGLWGDRLVVAYRREILLLPLPEGEWVLFR